MKKLILFLLLITLFACQKNEDWEIVQIVNLQSRGQIETNCPGKVITLDLVYNNLSYDELHCLVKEKTFSVWIAPYDTIWVLKDYAKLPDMWYTYSDSVLFTSVIKNWGIYVCPEY